MLVRTCLLLSAAALGAAGQPTENPYRESVAAIEASVAQQQASVARQLSTTRPAPDSFFYASWPMGSAVPAIPPIGVRSAGEGVANDQCAPIPPSELHDYVEEVSAREGVCPDLLRAVIQRESAFFPCAVSHKGAQGLMQIMPETGATLGLEDPFDPLNNIDAGARFLSQLLSRYSGDVSLALAAYNAGPTTVDRYEGLPPIPETVDYVSAIMSELAVTQLDDPPTAPAQVIGWDPVVPLNVGDE